jgi:hypothetical protein
LSSITFGALTFADVPAEPSAGSYTLAFSSCPEIPVNRREVIHPHLGLDGIRVVDGGAAHRNWRMVGMVIGDGEAGMIAGWNAVRAVQSAGTDTLTRYGEALAGVDCPGGPRPTHCETGRYCYQHFEIIWRQP